MACCVIGALLIAHAKAAWRWVARRLWFGPVVVLPFAIGVALITYHHEHALALLAALWSGDASIYGHHH